MARYAKWLTDLTELPDIKEYIGSAELEKWLQARGFLQGKRSRASLNKWLKRQVELKALTWRMIYKGCRAEPRYKISELREIGELGLQ